MGENGESGLRGLDGKEVAVTATVCLPWESEPQTHAV